MSMFALVLKQAALLVMHYQTNIMALFPSVAPALLSDACVPCGATRAEGINIYFVKFHFSPGYPEVNLLNESG